jgi:hypothetical protein
VVLGDLSTAFALQREPEQASSSHAIGVPYGAPVGCRLNGPTRRLLSTKAACLGYVPQPQQLAARR